MNVGDEEREQDVPSLSGNDAALNGDELARSRRGGLVGGEADEPWVLRHALALVLIGAVIAGGLLVVALFVVDPTITVTTTTTEESTIETITDDSSTRELLVRIATGLGAAVVALLAWGRLELSRREHLLARDAEKRAVDAQQTMEQGHVTERYARAVEQLGSSDTAVRLGALYALERLAHDSPNDRQTIYGVICAYVRHHSIRRDADLKPLEDVDGLAVDYHAAIDIVLAASGECFVDRRDLAGAVIANRRFVSQEVADVSFDGAKFTEAVEFHNSTLQRVRFDRATLTEVLFFEGGLRNIYFDHAHIADGHFERTPLVDVSFQWATFTSFVFAGSKLTGCDFSYAHLEDTYFHEVTLEDVKFDGATLTKVQFGDGTRLPEDIFDGATLKGVRLPKGLDPGDHFMQAPSGWWYGTRDIAVDLEEIRAAMIQDRDEQDATG